MNKHAHSSLLLRTKKRILIVGSLPEEHFPGVELLLRELPVEVTQASASWISKNSIAQDYDLILVPQVRPVVVEAVYAQINDHFEAANSKPIFVQLLGTWCEGEGRTGKVQKGWKRLFWHQAPRWFEAWLSPSERIEHQKSDSYRLIEVSADRQMVETLREALLPGGWYVLKSDSRRIKSNSAIGIWQGTQISGREASRLEQFVDRFRGSQYHAPVIALVDFPRIETVSAAKRIGVLEVVGLPVGLDELLLTIQSVVERSLPISSELESTEVLALHQNSGRPLAA